MAVSSKWYVSRPVENGVVYLSPVCRGIENREWASATPGGEARMVIQNAAALAQFEYGKEYEAVWVEVAKPEPHDGHPLNPVTLTGGWNPATGKNDRTYYSCGTCGMYARLADDGTPDWTAHEEHYGKAE